MHESWLNSSFRNDKLRHKNFASSTDFECDTYSSRCRMISTFRPIFGSTCGLWYLQLSWRCETIVLRLLGQAGYWLLGSKSSLLSQWKDLECPTSSCDTPHSLSLQNGCWIPHESRLCSPSRPFVIILHVMQSHSNELVVLPCPRKSAPIPSCQRIIL